MNLLMSYHDFDFSNHDAFGIKERIPWNFYDFFPHFLSYLKYAPRIFAVAR